MKRTQLGAGIFLSGALMVACSGASNPPIYDFAFPPFDLAANAKDASGPRDFSTSAVDFAGADLSGVDLQTAAVDLAGTDAGTPSVTLTLNEVNPRITTGDEVELLAHGAGSVAGWTIAQSIGSSAVTVATLPTLTVADGDLVVVHLKPVVTVTAESTAKNTCVDATCPTTAWDVLGSATQDFTNSAEVVTLANPMGKVVDGLAFSNGGGAATWPAQLQALQTAGVWDPTPCPNTCAKADADTLAVATGTTATGVGTTVAGNSMQRIDSIIPSTKAHWTVKASTWGAVN